MYQIKYSCGVELVVRKSVTTVLVNGVEKFEGSHRKAVGYVKKLGAKIIK